jgi:hypothetical protein
VAGGIDRDHHRPTLGKLVAANGERAVEHAQHWLAGLNTPAGRKAVPEPSFGAYCGKTLGPKLVRLGRDALERRRMSTKEVESPWPWRVRRYALGLDWDDCWGPRPGLPGCKVQFDPAAVTDGLRECFRSWSISSLPPVRESYERHLAAIVGPESARSLMDLVRERRAAAASAA